MNECEKLIRHEEAYNNIMMFLEWLSETKYYIGEHHTKPYFDWDGNPRPELDNVKFRPIGESHTDLLMFYFDIDVIKLESERRELLENLQREGL